jgi:hypothetical protein
MATVHSSETPVSPLTPDEKAQKAFLGDSPILEDVPVLANDKSARHTWKSYIWSSEHSDQLSPVILLTTKPWTCQRRKPASLPNLTLPCYRRPRSA